MKFSSRAIIKIVKLSRTIADFDESPEVRLEHLKETICFTTFSPWFTPWKSLKILL